MKRKHARMFPFLLYLPLKLERQFTMKKRIFTMLVLAMTCVTLQARPVDQETAKRLGQSFVKANFEFTRQSDQLNLVQTAYSERGEACYYIFNVGDTGFVILAADDNYRPVIGYSDRGAFNPDDMAPALAEYLEVVRQGVMRASLASSASVAVAADWAMLEKNGRLVSRHGGREDVFLVQTTWNQNYPYNYFCPEGEGSPGGHCYAGCVATAAAQLMKFWNHPIQGQGSYTYIPEDHPEYGPLTANFGETTYDWDNMPNAISNNSPIEQIEAVAQLIYHVGVSVDMNYRPTSSGAVTGKLCQTMPAYFFYTDQMDNLYRENYTHEGYMQLVINSIDMNWPMVQRGGGHAYVLDGYNDNDMVHFNWGWSGSSDGWFNIDEHGYADGESIIYNYVPAEIYSATANAPTDMNVVPANDGTLTASISWKNPSITLTNVPLTVIDQIVVARNGEVIFTEDNVTPGAEMSFVDESVPYFDVFDYAVYAIINGQHGASARAEKVLVAPTCDWKIIMQSSAFQGWNGGYVSLYSATGKEIQRFTITSSVPSTFNFPVPVGNVCFGWTAPNNNVSNMSLIIKDSEGNTAYTYQGNSSGMGEGVFYAVNNGCGNALVTTAPYHLMAEMSESDAVLTWENGGVVPDYGYIVYKDEQIFGFTTELSFVDENIALRRVTAKVLPTSITNMWATTIKSSCYGINQNLAMVCRAIICSANKVKTARMSESSCSAHRQPISPIIPPTNRAITITAFTPIIPPLIVLRHQPPSKMILTSSICADGMTHVTVFNQLGQLIFASECDSNSLNINVSDWNEGIYLVKVMTGNGWVSHRVAVVH